MGFAADRVFDDPRRGHPVAAFGRLARLLEKKTYLRSRYAGAVHVALLLVGTATTAAAAQQIARGSRAAVLTAGVTWAVLGGQSLEREALAVHRHLCADNLAAARRQIRNLVGRDSQYLSTDEIARACVESVAENTSDAVVAPLVWGAVAGVPGLMLYRVVNTLDAMIGYRNDRYKEFGWGAARLDDVLNWLPARFTVALLVAFNSQPAYVWRVVRRDAGSHLSPNAGLVEAGFAAALSIRLGGVNIYNGLAEDRGQLGDGTAVTVCDIPRAVRVARQVSVAALVTAVVVRATIRGRHRYG